MSRPRATPPPQGSAVAACLAISLACGAPAPTAGSGGADDQGSETTDPATTIPLPPDPSATSTTLPTTTVADGGTDSAEGSVFLQRPDGSNPNFECDIGLQDCKPGFKCMPYNERPGEMWDASACFPIVPEPVGPGEPCHWEGGPWSGYDDCGWAQVCWTFQPNEAGICKGLCLDLRNDGQLECADPQAIPYTGCQSCFCTCEMPCNPLVQSCGEGQVCYYSSYGYWLCAPDASGDMGGYGDVCEYVNGCDPGLTCLAAELVPGCESEWSCCTPFCDVTLPNMCPGAADGQTCQPWYRRGTAPHGLENLGVCALPQ